MAGPSRWPDLPPDLTALILLRLPWLLDRLSFRAVCRAWRLLPHPPAPPPLLRSNDGDTLQSLAAAATAAEEPPGRLFTAAPEANTLLLRCYDDWLLCCNVREATCFLLNPLASGAAAAADVLLLCDDRPGVRMEHPAKRIIACSPDLLAGLLGRRGSVAFYRPPPAPAAPSWSVCPSDTRGRGWYLDISLYRGKIYALKNNNELFFYDLAGGGAAAPEHVFLAYPPLEDPKELADWIGHLVVSPGKLLMVRWSVPSRKGIKLLVFEADLEVGRWLEVHDLDGQALFVGRGCSRALRFTGDDERLRGNPVYFLWSDLSDCCHWIEDAGTPSYGYYDLSTGKISQVFLDGRPNNRPHHGTDWFFPCL